MVDGFYVFKSVVVAVLDFTIKYRGSIFNYFIASFLAYHHHQNREDLLLVCRWMMMQY